MDVGRRNLRPGFSDRVFHVINYIYLFLALLIVLFPLINVVSQSLSSPNAVITGKVFLWPIEPTLDAYRRIFENNDLMMGFGNSIFYTVVGTSINLIMTIMAAYPLSKKDFYGKNVIIGIFVFTMMFNAGLIPNYLLIKSLGLYNTRWVMVIPNAMSVWNVMIARTFFKNTIPEDMCEAAELDGASDIETIISIILPLSTPIIAVLTLFYAVGHWNSYFSGLIYLQSKHLLPLQVVLRNILASTQIIEQMTGAITEEQAKSLALVEVLRYAIIVFASLPVIILYPFIQKYFVKGVMIGALKG